MSTDSVVRTVAQQLHTICTMIATIERTSDPQIKLSLTATVHKLLKKVDALLEPTDGA